MLLWNIPETDDERISVIQTAINQDELLPEEERHFSAGEIVELGNFLRKYEGEKALLQQSMEERTRSAPKYRELFKNAQMYVSHFIQVLQLSAIRGEIKPEHLSLYGFEKTKEYDLPDLSTEEAILRWGEKIIAGERDRISQGGMPLYNPAIAKVKVHYELFADIIQSLKINRQNILRYQSSVAEIRNKSTEYIEKINGFN